MQVLPNGQIKIKNNLSGEERIINPSEMAQYKISPDAYNAAKTAMTGASFTPSGNQATDIAKATAPGMNYGAGDVNAFYAAQNAEAEKKIYGGMTKEQYTALQDMKNKATEQAEMEDRAKRGDITQEGYADLMKRGIFLSPELTKNLPTRAVYNQKQSDKQAADDQYTKTKAQLQGMIDFYNSVPDTEKGGNTNPRTWAIQSVTRDKQPLGGAIGQAIAPQAQEYESQKAGTSAILANLIGGGQGSGMRINDYEMRQWAEQLPSVKKSPEQNATAIKQLNAKLEAKFGKGKGLDPQYLPTITTKQNGSRSGGYKIVEVK